MKAKMTSVHWRRRARMIDTSLEHLRIAREMLRIAGARQAANYVARALKSVEGAHRHASGREITTAMEEAQEKGDA